jgi:tetratricopeptide (TPR) repeat protein
LLFAQKLIATKANSGEICMRLTWLLVAISVLGVGWIPASAETEKPPSTLELARAALKAGKPQEAIALIDPLIAKAQTSDAKDPKAMCPSVAVAVLSQFMNKDGMNVTVTVEDDWCEAMLIKGYALGELKRRAEAVVVLEQLVAHDGSNPNYLAEYGFALQANGQLDGAFNAYKRVKGVASSLRDSASAKHWRAVALRGLGYVHIERQQWDEAVKAYNASLKDEPDSNVAKSELEYIRQKRPTK